MNHLMSYMKTSKKDVMNSIGRHFSLGELFKVKWGDDEFVCKCVSTEDPNDSEVILRILDKEGYDDFECISDFLDYSGTETYKMHYCNYIVDFEDYQCKSFLWSCDSDMIVPLSKDLIDTKLARKMYKKVIKLDNNLIRVWND